MIENNKECLYVVTISIDYRRHWVGCPDLHIIDYINLSQDSFFNSKNFPDASSNNVINGKIYIPGMKRFVKNDNRTFEYDCILKLGQYNISMDINVGSDSQFSLERIDDIYKKFNSEIIHNIMRVESKINSIIIYYDYMIEQNGIKSFINQHNIYASNKEGPIVPGYKKGGNLVDGLELKNDNYSIHYSFFKSNEGDKIYFTIYYKKNNISSSPDIDFDELTKEIMLIKL